MTNKTSAWRSPWVIAWVSMLVIFFVANVIMIYLAVDRNPGLVDKDFYDRGQYHEQNMLKRQARDPGWKMKLEAPKFVDVGKPTSYGFRIEDREGNPVTPDSVTFYVYRPADADADFSVPMEADAPGHYGAEVTYPLLGVWDILVSVRKGEDEYNHPHRVSAGVK